MTKSILDHVNPIIILVLSINGFSNIYAFQNIKADDELLKAMENYLRNLPNESHAGRAIEKLTGINIENFKFSIGLLSSIREISELLSHIN